jgi:hypothetical protein
MGLTGKLTIEEIKEILNDSHCADIDCFVETGTYHADSTLEAASVFEDVYSIEINQKLYEAAYRKCHDARAFNIHLYQGDSLVHLKTISERIDHLNLKAFWFLDAHQSGPDTSNNGTSVPLLNEINVILSIMKSLHGHVFVIDDARLFNAYWDWQGITTETITNLFANAGFPPRASYVKNDRFVVLL